MEKEYKFWLAGGDLRLTALAKLLREDGHTVRVTDLGSDGVESVPPGREMALAHCVILPLPVLDVEGYLHTPLSGKRRKLGDILEWMAPGQILCGGMVPRQVYDAGEKKGLRVFDYYAREECMVSNAVPTAEGAVQVAMEKLPITLHNARVLILGFGRVGKLTAHRMSGLGAKVTVLANDYGDLAWAAAYGYQIGRLEEFSCELGGFDLIVNTIPAVVLTAEKLRWVQKETFLLDLASAPGGMDRQAAEKLGLSVMQAPGLPGRTAPVSSAAAIRDAVYHILEEANP